MIPLEFSLKGKRTYFRGTDLLSELLEFAAPTVRSIEVAQEAAAQDISVHFHRLATRPLQAGWVDTDELKALRAANALVALLSIRVPERHVVLTDRIEPHQAHEPVKRIDWDETAIVQNIRSGPDGQWHIAVPQGSVRSLFEHVIALNKQLLNRQFGTHDWLWGRIDLPRWNAPTVAGTLEMTFVRQIRDSVFVSEALFDKAPLARIYFSKKPLATP